MWVNKKGRVETKLFETSNFCGFATAADPEEEVWDSPTTGRSPDFAELNGGEGALRFCPVSVTVPSDARYSSFR